MDNRKIYRIYDTNGQEVTSLQDWSFDKIRNTNFPPVLSAGERLSDRYKSETGAHSYKIFNTSGLLLEEGLLF